MEVFIETRGPSAPGFNETTTGFKLLPQKTRKTAKNPRRVSLKPGKKRGFLLKLDKSGLEKPLLRQYFNLLERL